MIINENKINKIVNDIITEVVNSKASIKNHIYKIISPFSGPKFRDNDWRHIRQVISAIENAGYDVYVSTENGGYRNSAGGNTLYHHDPSVSYWKEWNLKIVSKEFDGIVINGVLRANFCGSVNDPYDAYDITCTLW